jgi:hypothetical protein
MDKFQNLSNFECHTPPSESFRFYLCESRLLCDFSSSILTIFLLPASVPLFLVHIWGGTESVRYALSSVCHVIMSCVMTIVQLGVPRRQSTVRHPAYGSFVSWGVMATVVSVGLTSRRSSCVSAEAWWLQLCLWDWLLCDPSDYIWPCKLLFWALQQHSRYGFLRASILWIIFSLTKWLPFGRSSSL